MDLSLTAAHFLRRQGGVSPEGDRLVFISSRLQAKSATNSYQPSVAFSPQNSLPLPSGEISPLPTKRAPQKGRVAVQTHCFPLSSKCVPSPCEASPLRGIALCWMEGRGGREAFKCWGGNGMWLQCGWVGGGSWRKRRKAGRGRMSSFHPAASACTCSAEV